jgi:hypothetical protein
MKTIKKDELYRHVGRFLKSKGIELTQGSYSQGIHAGCSMLADAINLSQNGIQRAKAGIDRNLEKVREVIHAKTAPKGTARAEASKTSTGIPPVIVQAGRARAGKRRPTKAKKSRNTKR